MDEICCSLCCVELKDQDATYGLTAGIIDESCGGFRIDSDSDWDVYCADCMNEIDRLISTHGQTRSK